MHSWKKIFYVLNLLFYAMLQKLSMYDNEEVSNICEGDVMYRVKVVIVDFKNS